MLSTDKQASVIQQYRAYIKDMTDNWCASDIYEEFIDKNSFINNKFQGFQKYCYGDVVIWIFDAFLKQKQFVTILTSFLAYLGSGAVAHFALLRIGTYLICEPSVNQFTVHRFIESFKDLTHPHMQIFYNPVTKNRFISSDDFIIYGLKDRSNVGGDKCRAFCLSGMTVRIEPYF